MTNQVTSEYRNVPLTALEESKTNPRRVFDEAALKELAESIRSQGVLSPLLVRPIADHRFEIVAGARRYRAALLAEAETHARFHHPFHDPHILAVNTNFGGARTHVGVDSRLEMQERTIQQIALAHPDTLLVFPESIIPSWNGMYETRWASVFAQLKQQRTGLLIGTTIPIPNTEANRNVPHSLGKDL